MKMTMICSLRLIRNFKVVNTAERVGTLLVSHGSVPSCEIRERAGLNEQPLTEDQAERLLAVLRWPNGPVCPFCGNTGHYVLDLKNANRRRYKCSACRKQFSVTKGTILEGSKLSLVVWVRFIQFLCKRSEDVSLSDIHHELNVSYGAVQNALDRLAYALKRAPLRAVLGKSRNP